MALSLLAKLRAKYFQQFIKAWGREPQNPKEWMSIQDAAVRELNKTKGVPGGPKKPPFQGWKPKVIPGGKGIESLLESGVVKKGVAPKTTKETLKAKKDKHILLRDSEEGIARIKRKNKQAVEDFKKKFHKKKTVEEFKDEGDWDPYGMASGGRIGMAGGGALFKFIEKLFIKASNDIRLARGKWKGLDQKQRIVQHDNLTKKVTEFQKTGKLPEGTEQYFDVNPHEAFAAAKTKATGKLSQKAEVEAQRQEQIMKEAYDEIAGGSGFSGDYKYDADILADSIAEVQGKVYADLPDLERTGIYDQALKRVTKDLKTKIDVNKKWADLEQKMELQMFDPKDRKPNASGGRVPLMYGGDPGFAFEYGGSWADWRDRHQHQMPVTDYIKTKLPKERLPFRDMQSGGLAYMLGEPTYMKYGVGGSVGHAPWLKPTGQPQPQAQQETPVPNVASKPDPLKAPRGLPSLAPKNMDPAYMQQQMMQKAMMGRGQGNMAQGPRPMAAEGGIMRMGFKKGGDMSRRGFMKLIAGLAALPVVGKYFKLAKPAVKVASTIAKSNAPGMPIWFPKLVQRVIKEGEDVSKGAATIERQTVHKIKLPESGTPVEVTRNLVTDDIIVDIGEQTKHGWGAGRHGQPTRLVLKKGEWIEPTKTKKGIKTKDEFFVEEAEFTGGHPENVKFEEVAVEKYGDHASDFTEVEKFATGKNIDKKIIGKKAARDDWAEGRAMEQAEDVDDFAKGGRVPLGGGGGILRVLKEITKKLKKIKKPEDYIMDKGYKLGQYYKKNPKKGLSHSTAAGTGVLISRHLDRQKRGKKASGGLAHLLGE